VTDATLPQFELTGVPSAFPALRREYGLFVAGEWTAGAGAFPAIDPATEETIASVACASEDDVERALRGARRGYEKHWRKLRPAERAKYLFRFARAVEDRTRELAAVECRDAGTPIRHAREHDAPLAAATLYYYAGWADKLAWAVRAGERARPLGVVAALTGTRAPVLELACVLGPALAAGNAVVLVPSPDAALSAAVFADAALDAGLPPGILTLVTGDARTRERILDHRELDALTLWGSRLECALAARSSAGLPRRTLVQPDLPAAVLVFADAPLEDAAEGIARAAWFPPAPGAGAAPRAFVQETVFDAVAELVQQRLATVRWGDPFDENADAGPLASRAACDDAAAYVDAARAGGARDVASPRTLPASGYWYAPTMLLGGASGGEPARPVVPLASFRTAGEALESARDPGRLGSAAVWTASGQLAASCAERLGANRTQCNAFGRFEPAAFDAGSGGVRAYLHT
jgi:acyl-CoA reductase-like NAD-dependent aldehyde dehydrogenase